MRAKKRALPPVSAVSRVLCAAGLIVVMPWTALAQQASGDVWRGLAQQLGAGTEVNVRLQNGQRFAATLLDARPDALVLQPRTRRPVPVQPISYDAIVVLERRDHHGMGAAKAAGIGIAAGAGTFLAVLAIFAATLD